MLAQTTQEIEEDIRLYLDETENLSELLNFNLGPGSPVAKTHLFSSVPARSGSGVHYKLVSERATQLLVEMVGKSGINTLYSHAAKINNPAFLGWIIEADYFSRCEANSLQLIRSGGTLFDVSCPNSPVEFDVGVLELLASLENKTELKRYLTISPEVGISSLDFKHQTSNRNIFGNIQVPSCCRKFWSIVIDVQDIDRDRN